MVTVTSLGQKRKIQNPANLSEWTEVQIVTFQERGRSGANNSMAESTDALNKVLGVQTGLDTVRTHSHPVRIEVAQGLSVGKEMPLFINRKMYSLPQLEQQVGAAPRMVNGRPTYFLTYLSDTAQADEDLRLKTEELIAINKDAFSNSRVSAAQVVNIDEDIERAIGRTQNHAEAQL